MVRPKQASADSGYMTKEEIKRKMDSKFPWSGSFDDFKENEYYQNRSNYLKEIIKNHGKELSEGTKKAVYEWFSDYVTKGHAVTYGIKADEFSKLISNLNKKDQEKYLRKLFDKCISDSEIHSDFGSFTITGPHDLKDAKKIANQLNNKKLQNLVKIKQRTYRNW